MLILRKIRLEPEIVIAGQVSGDVDGVNKDFITTYKYKTGRISVLYNGQALHSPEDFTEVLNGASELKIIRFNHYAPHSDDILRATYEVDV
jgi:hypothetical protein